MPVLDNRSYFEAEAFGCELISKTVGELLDERVADSPDKEALVYDYPEFGLELRLTYRQVGEIVDRLSRGLLALGLKKGDHAGVWATNVPEWYFLQLAIVKIGAIIVTINTNYRRDEVEYVLRQGDIKVLFLIDRFRTNDYLASLFEIAPEISATHNPVDQDINSANLPVLRKVVLLSGESRPGLLSFPEVLELSSRVSNEALDEACREVRPEDLAMMQYTSGTTGFPKGVLLTHHSLVNQGHVSTGRGNMGRDERVVTSMPFFHIAGSLGGIIYSVYLGATLIPLIYFDPLKQLELFQKERASFTFAVPTMLLAMLHQPEFSNYDLSSLRSMFTGATPVPVALMEDVKKRMGADCSIVFGMTETTGAVTQSFHTDSVELKSATVGLPQPFTSIKIVDPVTGEVVPLGVEGELCSKAFSNMTGYYKMPEQTRATIDPDGWLHSGDLAVMRPDGYLNIVGRVKDMVIRGGENVYPAEVEATIMRHPAVTEVQVVGVPDAVMGEETCALLRVKAEVQLTEEEFNSWCRASMARHKVPKYVRFVDSFPLTPSGKVQKFVLRDRLIAELGLSTEAGQKTA